VGVLAGCCAKNEDDAINTNAMERTPFFPTERTAKKWLSVDTSFSMASPAEVVKS
jgi:hypothetical protein